MMSSPSFIEARIADTGLLPFRFLIRETLYMLRSRQTKLVVGFMIYAVVAMPLAMSKPPEEIMKIVAQWFGRENIIFKAFLYIWLDLGLNKLIAIIGPIFGAGIITRERAEGTLVLFLTKPITGPKYFLTKLAAACTVFSAIYLLGVSMGSIYFPLKVQNFELSKFLLLSLNHIFAGIFCVVFSATLSLFFKQRVTGLLASVMLLFLLISFAFVGFFNPDWRSISYFCPFYYGVALFAHFDHLTFWKVVGPTLALISFCILFAAIGAWRASKSFY